MPAVFKTHADWSTKVKTKDLNTWLAMATQRHPPPSVSGRRIKPKYMAQTKARPPTFVLFATRAEQLPESYRRYLINSLRESFDLPGVPLRVSLRSTRNPFADGDEPAPRVAPRRARVSAAPETATAPGVAKAEASPKPLAKSRPSRTKTGNPGPKPKPKLKAGNPRGRTQKLSRPGVKPKRASRPTSNKRSPR
jgi:GTP-binding protein